MPAIPVRPLQCDFMVINNDLIFLKLLVCPSSIGRPERSYKRKVHVQTHSFRIAILYRVKVPFVLFFYKDFFPYIAK